MKTKSTHFSGFSLLEMSIVLIILSVLIGSVYAIIPLQTEQQNTDETNTKLEKIQAAIDAYVNLNGHLPCAASLTDGLSTVNFGKSTDNCTGATPSGTSEAGSGVDIIRTGAVPTRSLNLPDSYMFDAWNNRILYSSIKALSTTSTSFTTSSPTSSAIIIYDGAATPNQINNIPVAYVLVSHGKNGNGATNITGSVTAACPAGTTESRNCIPTTSSFVDAFHNDNPTSYYDDYAKWKTVSQQIRDSSYNGGSTFAGTCFSKFALVTDQYPSGTASQVVAAGWNPRNLNTIATQSSPSALTSAGAGTITVPAGSYYIKATAPSQGIGATNLRLFDITSSATLAEGMSTVSDTTTAISTVAGYFTFTTATTISVDQYVTNPAGNLGSASSNGASEVYTMVEIFGK